ncbi:MAG: Ribosome-binding factor A [Parcubacteria group bacterium Greene0416_14]|nr:MAG: Ribosome-binding factor A [Parcubacteria group bacterium Greene0416_14]TSD01322.1 MAG: Ribosome-binding factor A [Parcubacteria group bacterium Greene1014_15]TSD08010.1 MAG: Ribosome-binding factor A [Parcubacteria group bacterium Greene0714_4]
MPDIPFKKEKVQEQLLHLAAVYFQQESSKSSLITVTRALADNFLKRVTILFTVIPESKEKEALQFAKRREIDFKNYAKARGRLSRVPFIVFDIDRGERNRQKIDAVLKDS